MLACDRAELHFLDRLADRRRTTVPPTLAINDPVTSGERLQATCRELSLIEVARSALPLSSTVTTQICVVRYQGGDMPDL